MVCDDVRRFVYFFMDGTLGEQKKKEFSDHLDDCPGCGDRVVIQQRLRRLIRTRLTPASAPTSLRERITQSFRLRVEMTG